MHALDPQPGHVAGGTRAGSWGAPPASALQVRRWLGRLRVGEHLLDRCFGARAGTWLARANGLGFAAMAFVSARPLPDARAAVLRLALVSFSWCAGLAALSLAGPHPERLLGAGRGLVQNRGVSLAALRAERPLVMALWTLRKLGILALLVIVACLVGTSDTWRTAQLLGLAAGAGIYLGALGLGLGFLAHVCHLLGGSRGRGLLVGIVLLPALASPAWPELPTLPGLYTSLLDACLRLGS